MRKIERDIVDTMRVSWYGRTPRYLSKRDSVTVIIGAEATRYIAYALWRTTLASLERDNAGNVYLAICIPAYYRTNTTKSRLNAVMRGFGISERISQKDFAWYWSSGEYVGDGPNARAWRVNI